MTIVDPFGFVPLTLALYFGFGAIYHFRTFRTELRAATNSSEREHALFILIGGPVATTVLFGVGLGILLGWIRT